MKVCHQKRLWVIIPLLALVAIFILKALPEHDTPPLEATQQVEPMEPENTSPEINANEVLEVCPSGGLGDTQVGETMYVTDTSGGAWASGVTEETTVLITCGEAQGAYRLFDYHEMDGSSFILTEPDVVLETCGDAYCVSSFGMVMLEEIDT
jgi:hypothetical protein